MTIYCYQSLLVAQRKPPLVLAAMKQKHEHGQAYPLCGRSGSGDFLLCHRVGIKFLIMFYGDCRFATISAEDDVVKRLCITHKLTTWFSLVFVACFQHADYACAAAAPHCAPLRFADVGLLG